MAIIKKGQQLPIRSIVMLLYGEPGVGKTSLANTADEVLLIDFDKGADRASYLNDVLTVNKWEDVLTELKNGTLFNYKTIVIDTAKACLDDFLMTYVIKQDYKNARNKLAAYGAIGDEFKVLANQLRERNIDLIFIAHVKEEKEGDTLIKMPDITGGSYAFVMRISDQVGYMKTQNNQRIITWEPSDNSKGKNVAKLPVTNVPLDTSENFAGFMAKIIAQVKTSIAKQNEKSNENMEKIEAFKGLIKEAKNADMLNNIILMLQKAEPVVREAVKENFKKQVAKLGVMYNPDTKKYYMPTPMIESSNEPALDAEKEPEPEANLEEEQEQELELEPKSKPKLRAKAEAKQEDISTEKLF
ncbi:MAG: ATP-binding protein [Ignavibacteria bacterium]